MLFFTLGLHFSTLPKFLVNASSNPLTDFRGSGMSLIWTAPSTYNCVAHNVASSFNPFER